MDKEKKDQLFITIVILGTMGVVMTNILSKDVNFFALAIESIGFIVVMYTVFYAVPAVYKKTSNTIVSYFKRTRRAKFLVFALKPLKWEDKLEIFISVHNEEFWLNCKNAFAETRFIYADAMDPTVGCVKWYEGSDDKGEVSIPRKKHKLLHFATVDIGNDEFCLHKIDGDESFPNGEGKYTFPIHLKGKMFFGNRISKVEMEAGFDVVINYRGKEDILVDVVRHF